MHLIIVLDALQLVRHFLVETCVNPTFITNLPEIMSPWAKNHGTEPGLNGHFELFVNKFRVISRHLGDWCLKNMDSSF